MPDNLRSMTAAILMLLASGGAAAAPRGAATMAEHRTRCAGRQGWSDPAPPVRIFGNVYDIGTCGITVLLIAGDKGAIVIDGATAAAVPSIMANIARLGLRPSDVKLLLSSHEHGDHAGGLAALRRLTGAAMLATAAARPALASGVAARDDPQRAGSAPAFRGVLVDRIVRDREVVALGAIRVTVQATPGHAPGSTSWSWRTCEGGVCHDMVYADSVSAVSTDSYRFADHPEYVARFRTGLARIASLRCDLIITPHPEASALYERLAGTAPLAAPGACAAYAAKGRAGLARRLTSEAPLTPRAGARPPT